MRFVKGNACCRLGVSVCFEAGIMDGNPMPKTEASVPWLTKSASSILWNAAAILTIMLFFWNAFNGTETERLVVFLVAIALFGVFGNLDRLQSIKLWGLEAHTRAVIREAEDATAALRKLATDLGANMIYFNASQGRLAGPGDAVRRDKIRANIIDSVRQVGVCEEQLCRVETADKEFVKIDYIIGILRSLSDDENVKAQVEAIHRRREESGDEPDIKELQDLLRELAEPNPGAVELLDDLDYFMRHSQHRRPAVWANRDRWRDD
jgi:hypothetical protein